MPELRRNRRIISQQEERSRPAVTDAGRLREREWGRIEERMLQFREAMRLAGELPEFT